MDLFLQALYEFYCVAGDDDLLIGGDKDYLYLRVVSRDNLLYATAVVALCIELDAQIVETLTGIPTYTFLVLAYTGSEDDDIDTIHGCGISADVFLDAIVVHLQGEVCTLVTFLIGLLNVTHVR